ncbi:MAG: pyrimidine-nucleoside phosphorylase [Lachnospiraceae bacterium]|nr:pyrimidine-nucleoside phosphorylase [Lachnospiraceae bacterium]
MRMYDLIEKKKRGGALSREELHFMVSGFVDGTIPDYQMSAMLMAICFKGMTEEETVDLTLEMECSGDRMDLSAIPGVKVDKHSTGGVGDKTTLVLAPIVAACGGRVAKMSGRGLGHTGGTLDKLESIPGLTTSLSGEEFFRVVRECGLAVVGQTGNMVPADKKLYALRDVTATIDCVPLIASSIMSKKLAAGSDAILLDVKTGSGAFMKTPEEARRLAEQMVRIGRAAGRRTEAFITNMDIPLGYAIGNALEVREAVEVLHGRGPEDLTEVCLTLASRMLVLGGCAAEDEARGRAEEAVRSGQALRKLADMVHAQSGDERCIFEPERLTISPVRHEVLAEADGYIACMDTEGIGIASMLLGAGRSRKEDTLDYGAGISLHRKRGQYVRKGEVLAELYTSDEGRLAAAEQEFRKSIVLAEEEPAPEPLIYGTVREPEGEGA